MNNALRVYFLNCGPGNFGDLLTEYWIKRLAGFTPVRAMKDNATFFGCGSIMADIPKNFTGTILGTGIMREEESRPDLRGANILALRGELTAERIGVDVPLGDLGLLFALYATRGRETRYKLCDLPHYIVGNTGRDAHYIDIRSGVDNVVAELSLCDQVITSTLHGMILADTLGIPSYWVKDKRVEGNGFKFRDYGTSIGEIIKPNTWRIGKRDTIIERARVLEKLLLEEMRLL